MLLVHLIYRNKNDEHLGIFNISYSMRTSKKRTNTRMPEHSNEKCKQLCGFLQNTVDKGIRSYCTRVCYGKNFIYLV